MSRIKSRRRNAAQQSHQITHVIETVETRCLLSADGVLVEALSAASPPVDGIGNNVAEPEWGAVDQELLRLGTAEYGDGLASPAGEARPSAREISNAIASQTESIENDRFLTDYVWLWGQFLDHDIDLTEASSPAEAFDIEVPAGDPYFDPFGTGEVTIGLNRSVYEVDEDGVRQQINQITAFIDGSVVYGSDLERAEELRTFSGGLLKTSAGDLLPFNEAGLENAGGTSESLFLAGDVRANENVALASMHTIWIREHNRIANELAGEHPDLSDEELYQAARQQVVAQLQSITYNEFLPALLGESAIATYEGYDPNVNPGISNLFSTAAYRLGHSLLSSELQRVDADGNVIEAGHLPLQQAFFNPGEVVEHGVDAILQGAATQLAQELDTQVIDDVRNFLFGPPGAGGFDLVSLNIQRGRDHGLPDYNQARLDLGLEPVTSFDQITSNPELALALESTYGDVNEIDVWVGGLAEDHLPGSSVGELFSTILVDQFERLRDGDQFWYQHLYEGSVLADIESTTLADVIERNSNVTGLAENVFFSESVARIDLSDLPSTDVVVRVDERGLQILDAQSRRELERQSMDGIAQIQVIGDSDVNERIRLEIRLAEDALAGGIVVSGGSSGNDRLVVATGRRDDVIRVDNDSMDVNGIDVLHTGIESMRIDSDRGNDVIEIADDMNLEVEVLDGTQRRRDDRVRPRPVGVNDIDENGQSRRSRRSQRRTSESELPPVDAALNEVFGESLDELFELNPRQSRGRRR